MTGSFSLRGLRLEDYEGKCIGITGDVIIANKSASVVVKELSRYRGHKTLLTVPRKNKILSPICVIIVSDNTI